MDQYLQFMMFTPNLWEPDDVISAIEIAMEVGFKFITPPDNPDDRKKGIYIHPGSAKSLFTKERVTRNKDQIKQNSALPIFEQVGPIFSGPDAFFPFRGDVIPGSFISRSESSGLLRFDFHSYTREYGSIQGLINIKNIEEKELTAQQMLELVKRYYAHFQPHYAWLDMDPPFEWAAFEDILKVRLKEIMWVNFFGPAYVEKYGREFLMNAPGWKKAELDDGGVFLQLSPAFTQNENKNLRAELKAYFAPLKIKRFPWPYWETGPA